MIKLRGKWANPTSFQIMQEKAKTRGMRKESARLLLIASRNRYEQNKPLKWVCVFIGMLFSYIIGYELIPQLAHMYQFNHTGLNPRNGIDTLISDIFGQEPRLENILTEETLIMSYEYNSQTPRFFSKYFLEMEPQHYNYSMSEILEASVSQSELFLPKIIGDSMFLDVDILAKTPSLMAYIMAEFLILPKKGSN